MTSWRSFMLLLALVAGPSVSRIAIAQSPPEPSDAEKALKAEKAKKATWFAHILRKNETMAGITFPERRVPVVLVPRGKDLRPLVQLRGLYVREGWKLFVQENTPVKPGRTPDEFLIFAYLNSQINEVALTAKGPNGEVERELVYIFAPEAQEFQIVSGWDTLQLYIGLANLTYQQTQFGSFNSWTGLLGISYTTPEKASRWGLLAAGEISVLTMKSTPIDANPQAISARADISYRLGYFEASSWRTKLLVGGNMQTLRSNGSPFGFDSLFAAEVGARAQYFRDRNTSYIVEFHYSPLATEFLSSQNSFRLEGYWSRTTKSLKQNQIGLIYSSSRFISDNQNLRLDLISLVYGYSI